MESLSSSAENQEEEVNLQYSKYFDFSFGFLNEISIYLIFNLNNIAKYPCRSTSDIKRITWWKR